jgi:protein phosphatase
LLEPEQAAPYAFEIAAISDVGTEREHNEDRCAFQADSATSAIVTVADGVSGNVAGAVASSTAVEAAMRTWTEDAALRIERRLQRAVQQANIAVYDMGVVVPELRGMATTLTALAIDRGEAMAAHVGDCRLYLVRGGRTTQLTKDHTVVGERVRLGVMSEERARNHPGRSTLTRCLGRELIVAIDRISTPLAQGDLLIVCSDGLYNVLDDAELEPLTRGLAATAACRRLIDEANERGTADNLTAAVVRMTGAVPGGNGERRSGGFGLGARVRRLVARRG